MYLYLLALSIYIFILFIYLFITNAGHVDGVDKGTKENPKMKNKQ